MTAVRTGLSPNRRLDGSAKRAGDRPVKEKSVRRSRYADRRSTAATIGETALATGPEVASQNGRDLIPTLVVRSFCCLA
jgi:hypothetical protein